MKNIIKIIGALAIIGVLTLLAIEPRDAFEWTILALALVGLLTVIFAVVCVAWYGFWTVRLEVTLWFAYWTRAEAENPNEVRKARRDKIENS